MLVTIRDEAPDDVVAIGDVNVKAFGRPDEARLIERLRDNGAVTLSLVAAVDDRVVGHILYSPVRLASERHALHGSSDLHALHGAGLGPMAVLPAFQRQGIGSRLIAEGTRRLRANGCPFIVVLGHPEYYPRFGFVPASRHGVRCQWHVRDGAFMVLPLDPARVASVSGVATYRDEFTTVAETR